MSKTIMLLVSVAILCMIQIARNYSHIQTAVSGFSMQRVGKRRYQRQPFKKFSEMFKENVEAYVHVDNLSLPSQKSPPANISDISNLPLSPQKMFVKVPDSADPSSRRLKFCIKHKGRCAPGKELKAKLTARTKFSNFLNRSNLTIYVDDSLFGWFGKGSPWLSSQALHQCPHMCEITKDEDKADIYFTHLNFPSNRNTSRVNAVLNLEAHSYNYPQSATDTVLISYHAQSDIVVTYGYAVMEGLNMCINSGKKGKQRCEDFQVPGTPFLRWCERDFAGDRLGCIFQVVPHISRSNPPNESSRALAATWVSASCERHGGYLSQLMKHMKIDSMGGCYKNRDEGKHPALDAKDLDGIWWGHGVPLPTSRSARKTLIASHYKFYVSLENTILGDYVTEKFYEGFLTDAVMVYLGAPNAQAYAPAPHSFVNALDFEGPKALAAFLTGLAGDEARYGAYLAWKRERPVRVAPAFVTTLHRDLVALGGGSMLCRLCGLAGGLPPPEGAPPAPPAPWDAKIAAAPEEGSALAAAP